MNDDISFLFEQDVSSTPTKCNFEEMQEAEEWAGHHAIHIFEALPPTASRKDFVKALRVGFPALGPRYADRIVDGVVRRCSARPTPQFGPHPTDIFALVPCPKIAAQQTQLRRAAINMYLEKRATRPRHDPVSRGLEMEARAESRRIAVGMPSGLLRTVDYNPAASHTAPTWLVKGLLPDRGLGMLVGESQSGKSFLAIHATVCIARGEPFFGRKVKPGAVVYIAAEGGLSVLPRIKAADEAIGAMLADNHLSRKGKAAMARAPIKVITETPNLSREGDPAALARTLRALHRELVDTAHPLTLVVVDTWHAILCGGDEQASADTGHALKPLKDAVEELGLFVLIVHHPGKDLERGARGSSSLRAAVDTEIEIRVPGFDGPKAKPAAIARRVTLTKQRDGAVGEEFHYRLNTAQLGHDEEGDPWTTCTVAPCDAPALGSTGIPKGKHDARFRLALTQALAEHGGERAPMKMLRGNFNNAGPAEEKEEARRKGFRRAFESACDAGLITTDSCEQWVWFLNQPRDAGQQDTP